MSLLLLLGDTDSNPRSLFASGEQGGYYDPSVPNTLFQLSDGVTAATQPGDPVGLIIDSRNGGLSNLGSDLVTNGTFAADSDWTKGGVSPPTITGGTAVFNGSGYIFQSLALTQGKIYRVEFEISNFVASGTKNVAYRRIAGGADSTVFTVTGNGRFVFFINVTYAVSTHGIWAEQGGSGGFSIDNISVREIPGNHLYQTVSGSRGTLSREPESLAGTTGGKRNVILYSEEIDNAAWGKANVTVSANASTAPDNATTADRIVETAATGEHRIQNNVAIAVVSGTTYTASVYAKAAEVSILRLGFDDQAKLPARVFFNLSTGLISFTEAGSGTITSVGNGWYRCSITAACGTSHNSRVEVNLIQSGTTASYAGNTSNGLLLWGAQLETGSTATAYQKNTTQYDCTESGKRDCWAIDFDGSDDSYLTSSVDFSATDKMTVWAGVWKRSDATRGTVVELTATAASNNGAFHLTAPNAASATIVFESKGTSLTDASASVTAPATRILCGIGDIAGDTATLRVDGVQADSDTGDQGTGNYANAALYIGRRGNSTLPFSGRLYGLIIRGVQTTDAKVREFEKYVARITGRQI